MRLINCVALLLIVVAIGTQTAMPSPRARVLYSVAGNIDAFQPESEKAAKCQLGSRAAQAIEVHRQHGTDDSDVFSLRYAGRTRYFYESADESRGLSVRIACVGKKRRALVVSASLLPTTYRAFPLSETRIAENLSGSILRSETHRNGFTWARTKPWW